MHRALVGHDCTRCACLACRVEVRFTHESQQQRHASYCVGLHSREPVPTPSGWGSGSRSCAPAVRDLRRLPPHGLRLTPTHAPHQVPWMDNRKGEALARRRILAATQSAGPKNCKRETGITSGCFHIRMCDDGNMAPGSLIQRRRLLAYGSYLWTLTDLKTCSLSGHRSSLGYESENEVSVRALLRPRDGSTPRCGSPPPVRCA